tara:strand:+ start:646 stop:2745 length:2100 start_codon:yes stop_codon:yes gene_type:complete
MAKNIVLKITQKGARKTGKALKGVTTSAAGLASKVGLVSAGFGALSVKLAGDFQKSLLEVSTLMKNTNEETLPNLSNELRQVAGSSGLALGSLSKAKYDIVSAGFSNAAESAKILEVSTKLAVGGVTSAAAAADLLTTSLNAFGFTSEDADRVSDSLFTTVRLGKTTMDELASSMGQVLPFAKSMNLSFEDVGASMATLTASGISTAEATTALRATITALSAPSDGAKRAMDEAGISVKKFDDGTVDLISTIEQFKGVDQETIKKFIPNVRAILGVQTLANNFNVLKKNVKEFADDSAGATDTAFDKMAKGFNTTFNRLKNNIQSVMIEIGNVLIEAIQPSLDSVNEEFKTLGQLGFDNLGAAVREELPLIMNAFQETMMVAFNHVEKRSKIMGLSIKEHIRDAMPFVEGDFEKIKEFSDLMSKKAEQDTEYLANLYKEMYAKITENAQSRANDDFDINDVIVENFEDNLNTQGEIVQEHLDNKTDAEKQASDETVKHISMEQFQRNQLKLDMQKQVDQYETANVRQRDIDKITTKANLMLKQKQREANMSYTSDVLSLSKTLASKNKDFAKIEKGIAIGQAVMNTYLAATKAFAKAGGYPAGVIPAALSVANGLALVGEIERQSFADGGIVQGSNTGQGDTVPAMLTPGEVILNQAQQENLVESMGTININISGNVIGNQEFVRDTLIPEIQNGIKFA